MRDTGSKALSRRGFVAAAGALALAPRSVGADRRAELLINTPMRRPNGRCCNASCCALHTEACEIFHAKYFDERNHLLCFPRWGANDGPDDAIEHVNDWPLLHALGGSDRILELYRAVLGRTPASSTPRCRHRDVPIGREGMYVRSSRRSWTGSTSARALGLQPHGPVDADDAKLIERTRRFAGFYNGEDPAAPNYDRQHRIIRSMFNGSRGPLLRRPRRSTGPATRSRSTRFKLEHGERNYEEMLEHFEDYTDIVCDSPLNLQSTTLALNAYLLDRRDEVPATGCWSTSTPG